MATIHSDKQIFKIKITHGHFMNWQYEHRGRSKSLMLLY